ncbi:MAG: cold shock domain-containing protein, partial [Gaiellales bacterium]
INYELPDDPDAYLHRAGRTGRAGRAGVVLTLVAQKQRPKVEALLTELELPRRMLQDMRPAPEGRPEKVAPGERYRGGERTELEVEERPEVKPLPKVASDAKNARRADRHRAPREDGRPGEGTVTGYDDRKGFGFIRQSAGGPDVFFHRSTIKGSDIPRLRPGLRVTYALDGAKQGDKVRANRVTVAPRTNKPMAASAHLPQSGGSSKRAALISRSRAARTR